MEPGKLITYQYFSKTYVKYPEAVAKALERLVKKGDLVRQKHGVFYKPENTRFENLKIKESEVLRQYMYDNNRLLPQC